MTMIPISGIFSNLFLKSNIRSSKITVKTRVMTLKCSKSKLRVSKGEEKAYYSDMEKNASVFYIANGKNYFKIYVLLIKR